MISTLSSWKKFFVIGLLFLALFSQALSPVHAASSTVNFQAVAKEGPTTNPCAWRSPSTWPACFLVAAAYPIGLLVSFGAYLVEWGLIINSELAYTEMIKGGFGVTLGITNLCFVLAIIVIAIATIIGYESYGMKKNLWKLIVAALLVNFSLVICSVIISFFDQFAYYFASKMGNQGSGHSGVSLQLANMFQLNKLAAWSFGGTLSRVGAFVAVLIGILLAEILIFFTLMAVALSLIVRYFYLSILMILMPIAWLSWVVPGMQKHWSSWWEKFIQWAISPALLLAFLYIGLSIMSSTSTTDTLQRWNIAGRGGAGDVIDNVAPPEGGGPGFLETIMKMSVGLALTWGGIVAANSAGAKGAATIVGWGNKAGKVAKNRATIFGKRAATYRLRRPQGRATTERMQTLGNNSNSAFLRTIAAPVRMAGTALSNARIEGEKTLHESEKAYKDMPLVEQARRFGSTRFEDEGARFAILHNIYKPIEEAEKKQRDLIEKREEIEKRRTKVDTERRRTFIEKGEGSAEYKAVTERATKIENEYTEVNGNITKAHAEVVKTQKLLDLLPKNAREDLGTFSNLTSLPGRVGDVKYTNTKYGRMFVLYGEHEKKHKKSLEDELKERFSKKEDDHGDGHDAAGGHPAPQAPTSGTADEAHH